MKKPQPIIVTHLFPELLDELLALLRTLSPEQWELPTVCEGWSVKDVALHLFGGDVSILSRKRDEYLWGNASINSWDDLVTLINNLNKVWIDATRRMSPQLVCDLLALTGQQVCDYFNTLDPYALGGPVNWAGPDLAPVWLDLAREYTEFWHHQQHIRDAVNRPGLKQPQFFAPVLDAFVRALPHTYREVEAEADTLLLLTISGEAGGNWFLLKEVDAWKLYLETKKEAAATVIIPQDVAWQLFTKGISKTEAQKSIQLLGDQQLGAKMLDMVSIIA